MTAKSLHFPIALALAGAALWLTPASTRAESAAAIHSKLVSKESQIERKRSEEQVLSVEIAGYTARMRRIAGPLREAQARFDLVQGRLEREVAELRTLESELEAEREKQAKLAAEIAHGRKVVSARLVALYKGGDGIDLISVVLRSHSMAELIDKGEYIKRISSQDRDLITRLGRAKREIDRLARRTAAQEERQREVTAEIASDKAEINRTRLPLLRQRNAYDSARNAKQNALESTRDEREALEESARHLRADEAAISGSLQQAGGSLAINRSNLGGGNATLIWPVNGPVTSPYGPRVLNGTAGFHPGIDIGAPEGTPIRAAASGVVALMQPTSASGGFGNFTCIQHTTSMATCYAHQSRFGTYVGARVNQGDVIGYVGNTGFSFGAHLDLEVRINGSPVNPLNYL